MKAQVGEHLQVDEVREQLRSNLWAHWNPVALEQRIRQSQQERLLIRSTTRSD